jgi:hypothetical protein
MATPKEIMKPQILRPLDGIKLSDMLANPDGYKKYLSKILKSNKTPIPIAYDDFVDDVRNKFPKGYNRVYVKVIEPENNTKDYTRYITLYYAEQDDYVYQFEPFTEGFTIVDPIITRKTSFKALCDKGQVVVPDPTTPPFWAPKGGRSKKSRRTRHKKRTCRRRTPTKRKTRR